jgi:hypothetical protein
MDNRKQALTTVDAQASDHQSDTQVVDGVQERLRNYVPGSDEEKRLVRKIDMFMVPTLWFMCILAYVDRNNIVSKPSIGR